MNQVANVQRADPSRAMGPLVWLDMDQKALDDAYDQAVYAPNRDQVHKRNQFNSDRVRARLGAPKRLAYGPAEVEKQMASGNVLKRIITADEVAYVCTFLASPKAVAINGDVIGAGGGAPGSIHY